MVGYVQQLLRADDKRAVARSATGQLRCLLRVLLPVAPVAQRYPGNLLTRWDVSSILANGIFLTKKLKTKKNAQRVEND